MPSDIFAEVPVEAEVRAGVVKASSQQARAASPSGATSLDEAEHSSTLTM